MQVETRKGAKNTTPKNNKGQKRAAKKPIEFIRYTKEYSEFSDGVADLCDRSEFLFDLFKKNSPVGALPNGTQEMSDIIIGLITTKFPNKEEKANMLWEFNVSGNSVHVKTDKYLGFGYKVFVNNIQGNIIKNYLFSIDVYGDRQNDLITELESTGWKKFERVPFKPKKKEESKED